MRSQLSPAPYSEPPAPPPARDQRLFIPSLPTLDPALLLPTLQPPRPPLYPLDRLRSPATQPFYLARAAVHHAIRHWLGRDGGVVLMPAYHHGVEVEAVRAAGGHVEFYRVDRQLRVDLDDLARRASRKTARIVYLTHFIGFPAPLAQVREIVQMHNLRLFEDCALALFSRDGDGRPLGTQGDAACFCLYKTLPVPHGGLLVGPGIPTADTIAPPLPSTLHHAAGLVLAHLELRSPGLGRAARRAARATARATVDRALANVQTGTMHLQPRDLRLAASRWLPSLLSHIDDELVVVRRRRNFSRLAAALDGILPIVGAPLPPGVCPLFLPARIETARGRDKGRLVQALRAHGIDAIDFWSRGDAACDARRFPEVAELRREILELPCHQSLDDEDIDRMARVVKQLLPHA
jgi:perosamine synthetase